MATAFATENHNNLVTISRALSADGDLETAKLASDELQRRGRCPECGDITIRQEGCAYCFCGWSKCGG